MPRRSRDRGRCRDRGRHRARAGPWRRRGRKASGSSVLAEMSQQLASTLDYQTTLAKSRDAARARYADWYAVDVAEADGGFRRARGRAPRRDQGRVGGEVDAAYAPEPDESRGHSARGPHRRSAALPDDQRRAAGASTKDAQHHEVLRQLGMESAMGVPLTRRGPHVRRPRCWSRPTLSTSTTRMTSTSRSTSDGELPSPSTTRASTARPRSVRAQRSWSSTSPTGCVLVDRLGVIRLWNPAAEQISGVRRQEAVGQSIAEDS